MPLPFTTVNRGVVPFGFFNVESDMLLLAEYFAFAEEFCGWIENLAALARPAAEAHRTPGTAPSAARTGTSCAPGLVELRVPVWCIDDSERLGDFHGAMAGRAPWGFFGAVYGRFPFPSRPQDFRQDPEGWRTQDEIRLLADEWAQPAVLIICADPATATIDLGGYRFDAAGFASLITYLWRGGAPRWKGGVRPASVERMMQAVRTADSWLFAGASWPV
jgi:hypothetical protein